EGNLLERMKVARIKLHCALQITHSFLLLTTPAQNEAGQFKDARIIGQTAARRFQLGKCTVVVAQATIQIACSCEMRFASIWLQPCCRLESRFRRGQSGRSVVAKYRIRVTMSIDAVVISLEKRRG